MLALNARNIRSVASWTDSTVVLRIHKVIYVKLFDISYQLKQANRQKLKVKTIEGRDISITG